jgi:uncharacterized protein (TIGR02231 family)
MPRTLRSALLALSILTIAVPAAAEVVPADDARIVQVTVYRDRAEVIRQATVRVPAGASTVEFANIPFAVEADSLRVGAEGVPAILGAVELRKRVEEPKDTPELEAARQEVRRLEMEIDALNSDATIDKELKSFLQSLGKVTAARQAEDLGEGKADPEAIAGFYDLLESKLHALGAARLKRQEQSRELHEELELARARLQTLRPPANIRSRVAAVEVEAAGAGTLTLRLAYLQPGASWRPAYRATLDAATGKVSLIAEGVVRQSTGEDWADVDLHLSSASPAKGVEPPMLMSWVLRPAQPTWDGEGALAENVVVDRRRYQNILVQAPGAADAAAEPEPSAVSESRVVRSAYNVAFHVPGGSDIPADGRDHRVVLRQETLESKVVHRTVPGIDPRAYLTAITTSPEEYPLLAGPVRVFTGGAYLGSYPLKETGPGTVLPIPFGVDNRIEITRVPEPKKKSKEGFTGKLRQVHKTERTLLHNLMDREVTVVLEDRLPISEDERIVVQIGDDTTPNYKDSERRPGVMIWDVTLGPNEKKEVVLEYTVRFPREINLPDLE